MENLRLRSSQVRSALQILREAHDLTGDVPAQRQHLARGLMSILGAEAVLRCRVGELPDGRRTYDCVYEGLTHSDQQIFLEAKTSLDGPQDPAAMIHLAQLAESTTSEAMTRLRRELVPNVEWYRSGHASEVRRPARIDDAVCSMRRVSAPYFVEGIVVFREWGERPFEEEDRDLVHLFHMEWSALSARAEQDPTASLKAGFSPREKETLDLLVLGLSYKEVADRMNVTTHTVNEYVKRIYRKLSVHSRGELQALFARLARPARG